MEEHEAVAVCYVVQLADVRGKFDPKRAQALGVPKGPMFGQLQRGASVTTPEGRTVTPEEVCGGRVGLWGGTRRVVVGVFVGVLVLY